MKSVHSARQLDRSTFLSVTFLDHAPPTHPCLGHTFRRRDGCRGPGTLSAHKAVLKVTRFCLVRQTLLPCDQVTVLTPVLANCWSVLTPPLDCTNTSLSSGISVLTLIGGPRAEMARLVTDLAPACLAFSHSQLRGNA